MMNAWSRTLKALLALPLLLVAGIVHGEVGVVVASDSVTVLGGPFVSGIIDDADPINNIVWDCYRPASGNHVLLNEGGVANGDGAAHRVDRAWEFGQNCIAHGLEQTAINPGDLGIGDFPAGAHTCRGAFLVSFHQAGIADDIRH